MIKYENVNRQKFHTELSLAGIKTKVVNAINDSEIGCLIEFEEGTDMNLVQQIIDAHEPTPLAKPLSEVEQLRIEQAKANAEIIELMMSMVYGGGF